MQNQANLKDDPASPSGQAALVQRLRNKCLSLTFATPEPCGHCLMCRAADALEACPQCAEKDFEVVALAQAMREARSAAAETEARCATLEQENAQLREQLTKPGMKGTGWQMQKARAKRATTRTIDPP
jgi:hypothetical protein